MGISSILETIGVCVVRKGKEYSEKDTYMIWSHVGELQDALLTVYYCKNKYDVTNNDLYQIKSIFHVESFRDESTTQYGIEIKSLLKDPMNNIESPGIQLFSEEAKELHELIYQLIHSDY